MFEVTRVALYYMQCFALVAGLELNIKVNDQNFDIVARNVIFNSSGRYIEA
jgi:hypothetical protein